ncbi:MAG: hypothetical protein IPH07_25720 [Deltaproteobacteria bacterium]|nr:hypothetical protein [Deltaproteobacteria bacterium]MBK8240561.1 hypothetical protein [Deltaproteobacteria bacterium]MBK8718159.1 hypothetical protein [Deltaproteobacteria bacterium]MBP7292193.1 hypothetical protein [Nannocystaceae bacterium]
MTSILACLTSFTLLQPAVIDEGAEPTAAARAPAMPTAPAPVYAMPPPDGPRPMSEGAIRMAAWTKRRNGLAVGLGISLGAMVGGALSIGLGSVRARNQCRDSFCEGTPFFVGLIVGAPLLILGFAGALGTGVAWGVHVERRPPKLAWRLQPTAGGLTLRF